MTLKTYQNTLRRSELFVGVPAAALQAALDSCVPCKVKQGSCFFRSDEPANRFFVLMAGCVKLRLTTARGYRVLFRLIAPGDLFGWQPVLGDSAHYFTTAEAAADSEALCWSGAAMRRLLRSYPAIALNALSVSLARMKEYQERVSEMACESVPSRIARQLVRLASQTAPGSSTPVTSKCDFTRDDLAGMAGSTASTVSRILGRWQRLHIIEKSGGMVHIAAPAKLAEIAGS